MKYAGYAKMHHCDIIIIQVVNYKLDFKVQFRHNQLQKPLFGRITELQVTNIKD